VGVATVGDMGGSTAPPTARADKPMTLADRIRRDFRSGQSELDKHIKAFGFAP